MFCVHTATGTLSYNLDVDTQLSDFFLKKRKVVPQFFGIIDRNFSAHLCWFQTIPKKITPILLCIRLKSKELRNPELLFNVPGSVLPYFVRRGSSIFIFYFRRDFTSILEEKFSLLVFRSYPLRHLIHHKLNPEAWNLQIHSRMSPFSLLELSAHLFPRTAAHHESNYVLQHFFYTVEEVSTASRFSRPYRDAVDKLCWSKVLESCRNLHCAFATGTSFWGCDLFEGAMVAYEICYTITDLGMNFNLLPYMNITHQKMDSKRFWIAGRGYLEWNSEIK